MGGMSQLHRLAATTGIAVGIIISQSALVAQGIVYLNNAESGTPLRWDPWIDPHKLSVKLDLLTTGFDEGPRLRLAETTLIPDGPRQGYLNPVEVVVPGKAPGDSVRFLVSITGYGGIGDPAEDLTSAFLSGPGAPFITADGFVSGRMIGWDTIFLHTIPEPDSYALLLTALFVGWTQVRKKRSQTPYCARLNNVRSS